MRLRIGYPWWKNLRGGAAVRIHLRGKVYPATTEVLGEEGGLTVVEVYLTGEPIALSRSFLEKGGNT